MTSPEASVAAREAAHLPDASRVEALVGLGLGATEIARLFDIREDEVRIAFRRELASGDIKANARVAESLFRKATGEGREAVTAAIFWLKARARWKETSVHEHAGRGDSPMQVTVSYEAMDL